MESTMQMSLRSPAFEEGGSVPTRFTCDGEDLSPPLSWSEEPEGTGSFVLIADDPDASAGRNNFWRSGWGGPCPPSGEHRYRFTLFAISGLLGLDGTPSEDEVRAAMQGRVLAQGQLTAMYRRAR